MSRKKKKKSRKIEYRNSEVCQYTVYTDGGCAVNPGGKGGYAAVILHEDKEPVEITGSMVPTTNNRMEIMAVIAGLRALPDNCSALIVSDSQYFINTAAGIWRGSKNPDLWREYFKVAGNKTLSFRWVRGHNGNRYNERCDELCTYAIQNLPAEQDRGYDPAEYYKVPTEAGTKKTGAMTKRIEIPKHFKEPVIRPEDQKLIKPECTAAIRNILEKDKPSFRDYSSIRTGGMDGWSWTKQDELIRILGENTWDVVAENLGDDKACCTAMRWIARGLPVRSAIRKVYVDQEVSENALKSRKSSGGSP